MSPRIAVAEIGRLLACRCRGSELCRLLLSGVGGRSIERLSVRRRGRKALLTFYIYNIGVEKV